MIGKLTGKKVEEALQLITALDDGPKGKQVKKEQLLAYLTNNKKRID